MFDLLRKRATPQRRACGHDLSAYIDGRLSPRARSRMEKHLQGCETCRAELASLRHTVSLLRAVPAVRPPRSFFLPASEAVKQKQVRRRRLSYGYLRAASAVATVLLVLVVSGDAFLRLQPLGSPAIMSEVNLTATETAPHSLAVPMAGAVRTEAGQGDDVAAMVESVSASPTMAGAGELPDAAPALEAAPTTAVLEQHDAEPAANPSLTFARPAAPPASHTPDAQPEPASPTAAVGQPITPQPEPTTTPPSTLALPTPTAVVMSTAVAPTPQPDLQPVAYKTDEPPPATPSGWAGLAGTLRPSIPWLERILASTVGLLLVAMVWLRGRMNA